MTEGERFWRALIAAWVSRGEPTTIDGLPLEVAESAADAQQALAYVDARPSSERERLVELATLLKRGEP